MEALLQAHVPQLRFSSHERNLQPVTTVFGAKSEIESHGDAEANAGSTSECILKDYKYIIVGSGMGGGMLARKLMTDDTKEETTVVLLEKGGVKYYTHCLNTSRKHFDHKSQNGRGRDNEVMFDKYLSIHRTNYQLKAGSKEKQEDCGGGSVFELGGRSLFWSLEAPPIITDTLQRFFPPTIAKDLMNTTTSVPTTDVDGTESVITQTQEGWYQKAQRIVANSPPGDDTYPAQITVANEGLETALEDAREKLAKAAFGAESASKVKDIMFTPNGAEFDNPNNLYYFPQSAYSTSDWILDKAFNPPSSGQALSVQLNASVDSLTVKDGKVSWLKITGKDKNGANVSRDFKVGEKQTVILCAGTVNTAGIALRSHKLPESIRGKIGKNLTDHEIWMNRYSKHIESEDYENQQPVELSCYVTVHGHEALLTVCLNAEKFYGHGFADGEGGTDANSECFSVINIMLEFEAKLNGNGRVTLENNNPVIEMNRERLDSSHEFEDELKNLCIAIREEFGFESGDGPEEGGYNDAARLAPWGSVAHEVGTMRMDGPNDTDGVVDCNLKVKDVDNLYVCDLSTFPCSPMENPSLTLTALAMRLGDHLLQKKSK